MDGFEERLLCKGWRDKYEIGRIVFIKFVYSAIPINTAIGLFQLRT